MLFLMEKGADSQIYSDVGLPGLQVRKEGSPSIYGI